MSADPFTQPENPVSAQCVSSILSVAVNSGKPAWECQFDNEVYTLTQGLDLDDMVLSLKANPSESVILCNVTMSQLKEAALIYYLAEERRCGNTAIDLSQFDLSDINLTHVKFSGTVLNRETLISLLANKGDNVDFSGIALAKGTHVAGLCFAGVKMDAPLLDFLMHGNADLRGINVSNKDLSGMSLISTDFSGANFAGAKLDAANLKCANFTNVNLDKTTLAGAHIDYAIFTDISQEQIRSAKGKTALHFKQLPQVFSEWNFNIYNPSGLAGTRKVDKTKPYLKLAQGYEYPNQSRNGKVPFLGRSNINPKEGGDDHLIVCRHSTASTLIASLRHPEGKVSYRQFSSEQLLARNVPL